MLVLVPWQVKSIGSKIIYAILNMQTKNKNEKKSLFTDPDGIFCYSTQNKMNQVRDQNIVK